MAIGERAGRRVRRRFSDAEDGVRAGALCYASRGLSLHAATRVEATDRRRLERLCRYVIPPPVAAWIRPSRRQRCNVCQLCPPAPVTLRRHSNRRHPSPGSLAGARPLPPAGNRGGLQFVADDRPARDTWINTTWVGHDLRPLPGLLLQQKLKWQLYRQLQGPVERQLLGIRQASSFLGLINKAEYSLQSYGWTLLPRWKSEFLRRRPVLSAGAKNQELTELVMLLGRHGLMQRSYLEAGVEYELFHQFIDPTPPGADESFRGPTTTVQVGNVSDYQGYRITTLMGFEVKRLHFEDQDPETFTRAFITMYAGVEL